VVKFRAHRQAVLRSRKSRGNRHAPATTLRISLGELQFSSCAHFSGDRLFLAASTTLCFKRFLSTSFVSHFEPAIPMISAPAIAPSRRLICSRCVDAKSMLAPEPYNAHEVTAATPQPLPRDRAILNSLVVFGWVQFSFGVKVVPRLSRFPDCILDEIVGLSSESVLSKGKDTQ
jgi:hypothetical protein